MDDPMSDRTTERISSERLDAAIRAFETAVSHPLTQGLMDADILALKAMYELRERRQSGESSGSVTAAHPVDSYLVIGWEVKRQCTDRRLFNTEAGARGFIDSFSDPAKWFVLYGPERITRPVCFPETKE